MSGARAAAAFACSLGLALGLGLGLGLAVPGAARAEVLRMEAVGAAPLDRDAPSEVPPRDAALQRALADAVRRVAREELAQRDEPIAALPSPEDGPPPLDALLDEALGDQPLDYATRFRILEDRGERPTLFLDDPEVDAEYVLVVEVYVDRDRVRERLAAYGLPLLPSGDSPRVRLRLEIVDLHSYGALAALRETLLEGVGARRVVPVEMERGRAVLEVDADRAPRELLDLLRRTAPPELRVEAVAAGQDELTLRIALEPPQAEAAARSYRD